MQTQTFIYDPHGLCRERRLNHNANIKLARSLFKNCKKAYYLFARPDILLSGRRRGNQLKKWAGMKGFSVQTVSFTWEASTRSFEGNSEHPKGSQL